MFFVESFLDLPLAFELLLHLGLRLPLALETAGEAPQGRHILYEVALGGKHLGFGVEIVL